MKESEFLFNKTLAKAEQKKTKTIKLAEQM